MASTPTVADIVTHYLSEKHRVTKTLAKVATELKARSVNTSSTALSAWSRGERTPDAAKVKALRLTMKCVCVEFGDGAINHAYSTAAAARAVKPGRRAKAKRKSPLDIPDRAPLPMDRRSANLIVGRDAEVDKFAAFRAERSGCQVINIFGPGGIGKSEVFRRLVSFGRGAGSVLGYADIANLRDSEPGQPHMAAEILGALAATIDRPELDAFRSALRDYDLAEGAVRSAGDIGGLYAPTGRALDGVHLPDADEGASLALRKVLASRFAFSSYRDNARRTLADAFCDGLRAIDDAGCGTTTLLLDTYEDVGHWDDWVCNVVVPRLPVQVGLVILGRDQLDNANADWVEHGEVFRARPLPELAEDDALTYLRHYGLTDTTALQEVHRVTGGYPLLLFLARALAAVSGGWEAIGELRNDVDRDVIAGWLLDRILSKATIVPIRETLVTCSIAPWINPEIIHVLTGASTSDARVLFEAISSHSFVSRGRRGVVLHDKIRELLQARLRVSGEIRFNELEATLTAYFGRKGGSPNE
ncbi:hypothetical protein GFY24_33370 [Nocardia sp. SYP-A9097]|uniref:ATP-binding protein n=1 Tax=Nocardia sp. SYP-A9097 TaxID=2663237 RepID=UPI00129C090D|nr:ATP-binding protein [Nocardia sp. SYP-A9097]MRH92269.1 hypothetical protein [Nocardia sp. SYP-A9097]